MVEDDEVDAIKNHVAATQNQLDVRNELTGRFDIDGMQKKSRKTGRLLFILYRVFELNV